MCAPSSRLLTSLATDVARLRAVAAPGLTAPVPTCPDWLVEDLVRHVTNALRGIALRRVRGQDAILAPDPAPDPVAALADAHAAFVAELGNHSLDGPARRPPRNAHTPAETAYFWLRRMTHEIAVHRADVELALGEPVTAVPADLAVDGITEMLAVFLTYGSHENPDRYADLLDDWGTAWVLLRAGDGRWRIAATPAGVDATSIGDATDIGIVDAPATIRGEPSALLMWLYNRGDEVIPAGDPALVARVRAVLDRALDVASG